MFTFNDPSHFLAPCTANRIGVFGGAPLGATPGGGGYWAEIVAPPNLTINYATLTGANILNVNNGQGWGGGSFYAGGGSQWYNGQTGDYDGPFNSSYWGFQIVCGWSSCSNPANIYAGGIQLTAVENKGPTIAAVGSNNLWFQTRRRVCLEPTWGRLADHIQASDSSGVCRVWATVAGVIRDGLSAVPDTSVWHQCPDPVWEPQQGASVDTRDYTAAPAASL